MGYRIIYDGGRKRDRYGQVLLGFLLGLLLGACLVPDGRRVIQTALIPGDGEAVRQAYGVLRAALCRGEGLISSAWAFCREVAAGLG